MNKIINISLMTCFAFIVCSCENKMDNYDAPDGGIYGTIYDKQTNQPIPLPVQGSGGVMVSLFEQHTNATASVDFRAKSDGTYISTKVFNGDYRLKLTGPFVGVSEAYVSVNGQTQLDLRAIPLSRISLTTSLSDDNKVTLNYAVQKADNSFTLTDVSVIWNYAPGVDVNSANYAKLVSLGAASSSGSYVFDLLNDSQFIENHYKIAANKNRIYVRVSATVTLNSTTATNYSEIKEIIINDIR